MLADALSPEVNESYVSPRRLPRGAATMLFDPRSQVHQGQMPVEVVGEDVCPEGDVLRYATGPQEAVVSKDCRRCFGKDLVEQTGGYGYCASCGYAVCSGCLKHWEAPRMKCQPPLPSRELRVEAPKDEFIFPTLPRGPRGGDDDAGAPIPPPLHEARLIPYGTYDNPPCADYAFLTLGLAASPSPASINVLTHASLSGGEPGKPGGPIGRKWIARGDDAIARKSLESCTVVGERVAFVERESGLLRVGKVIGAAAPGGETTVDVKVPEQTMNLIPPPAAKTARVREAHLARISVEEAEVILSQQAKLEYELSFVVRHCLSFMHGCTHTDKPYVKRRKGNPQRGYSCEFRQCTWCGKVLVVNAVVHGVKDAAGGEYSRLVLDTMGVPMLVDADPFAAFRTTVEVPECGLQCGRGWTRKSVLLLPEIMHLHKRGVLHTADARMLTTLRAGQPKLLPFERLWLGTRDGGSYHDPRPAPQIPYGPCDMIRGAPLICARDAVPQLLARFKVDDTLRAAERHDLRHVDLSTAHASPPATRRTSSTPPPDL